MKAEPPYAETFSGDGTSPDAKTGFWVQGLGFLLGGSDCFTRGTEAPVLTSSKQYEGLSNPPKTAIAWTIAPETLNTQYKRP